MKIEGAVLLEGDCLELLRTLDDCSVDAVVTDPPYGLKFMGQKWDCSVPGVEVWAECLRILKPGGHLLAFAGTRTQHRMAVAIEDAGFEIRDMIAWVYGNGFPKSLDMSKAIDKAAGTEREVTELITRSPGGYEGGFTGNCPVSLPATESAKQWQGWGTALKPALEPITVARKPLVGTVAANVLEHGTGKAGTHVYSGGCHGDGKDMGHPDSARHHALGRYPANLIHDGSDDVCRLLRDAARFYYCAKASGADRAGNAHPTVKPTDLMRYLCRLVTPPGGIILDPFMGSGSTGVAALLEGLAFIGIEREADYMRIAEQRISSRTRCIQRRLF